MGRHVKFNQVAYINALLLEIEKALEKVEQEVFRSIVNNFGALKFRTLDAKFVGQMRKSIRSATKRAGNKLITSMIAGHENAPNESFRVIYYEYGTGERMNPPKEYSPANDGTWNRARPQRKGEPIWVRPYGPWKDAGGNSHFSRYKGIPRRMSPRSPKATPIEANYWFRRGFWEGARNIDRYVLNAVKQVNVGTYIEIASIRTRM
ncbi:hypothetical protein [Bacillus pumilus]|uniref:hypothetical protein n=1 Tax=Bacillus pumilus TaxID=1408 RepID=UPI0011E94DEE|nr:hypothetical protein [Bacillus pumilus]TYS40450.1 hypothetical protein FZC68_16710 [Bacillus pumilus]